MKNVRRAYAYTALLFAFGMGPAIAAKVDAKLVPDGTYGAKIERIRDGTHVTMLMENGMEVDAIAARHTVTFTPDLADAKVKVSLSRRDRRTLARLGGWFQLSVGRGRPVGRRLVQSTSWAPRQSTRLPGSKPRSSRASTLRVDGRRPAMHRRGNSDRVAKQVRSRRWAPTPSTRGSANASEASSR